MLNMSYIINLINWNLYYNEFISSSPYSIQSLQGVSLPTNIIAEGAGLASALVGKPATFTIKSVDDSNAIINNTNERFQVLIKGPGNTEVGNLYSEAVYDTTLNTGIYNVIYTPQKVGAYKVEITLLGVHITNSPFDLNVTIGEVNPLYTQLNQMTLPYTQIAGNSFSFNFEKAEDKYPMPKPINFIIPTILPRRSWIFL